MDDVVVSHKPGKTTATLSLYVRAMKTIREGVVWLKDVEFMGHMTVEQVKGKIRAQKVSILTELLEHVKTNYPEESQLIAPITQYLKQKQPTA